LRVRNATALLCTCPRDPRFEIVMLAIISQDNYPLGQDTHRNMPCVQQSPGGCNRQGAARLGTGALQVNLSRQVLLHRRIYRPIARKIYPAVLQYPGRAIAPAARVCHAPVPMR
jgi:hypothetical protein